MPKRRRRDQIPDEFLVATNFGSVTLDSDPEVDDIAEQIRAVIRGKQAEQYNVTAIVIGGKYWKSLVAQISGRVGKLLLPPVFDMLPIIAVDADVIEAVYGNAESLHFILGHKK